MCVCITAMGFKNRRRTGIVTLTNAARIPEHQHLSYIRHEHPQLRHQNRPPDSYGSRMRKPLELGHRGSAPDPSAKGLGGAACPVLLGEKEKFLTHEGQATEVTGP